MGHCATKLRSTDKEFKFPSAESSVVPLVWLRKHIGSLDSVVRYTQDDVLLLKEVIESDKPDYEKEIARNILSLLGSEYDLLLQIELSASAGEKFYDMLPKILPASYEQKAGHWRVFHDHTVKSLWEIAGETPE